jgi:glycosyltransferase involved in cell wall biosynthesis
LPIVELSPASVRSSSGALLRAVRPLRQLLARERPDLVCAVLEHASLAALWAAAGLAMQPRLVLCAQNNPERAFAGLHPLNVAVRRGLRRHYRSADAIVALSQGVAEALWRIDAGLERLTQVIPNAALDDSLTSLRHEPCTLARPNGPLLVACGRLNEQKGYPVLLDALKRLNADRAVSLWIVGDGPLRAVLERRVRMLGLADRVQFLGFRPNPYPFMAAADVFVLSSHYEGFGNVIVEAMACGAPVVSTDCPYGPQELIRPGESGILVERNNAEALASGLRRVLDDPALRKRLREAGSVTAERYRDTRIASEYGALFRGVLARPPTPGAS